MLRTMNCRQESFSCSALYKAANSSTSAAFLRVTVNGRSKDDKLIKKKQVCLDYYYHHHYLFLFALLALNALQIKSLCLIYNKNTLEKCGQYFINSAISNSCLRKHNKEQHIFPISKGPIMKKKKYFFGSSMCHFALLACQLRHRVRKMTTCTGGLAFTWLQR